jgi:hypothetical protein
VGDDTESAARDGGGGTRGGDTGTHGGGEIATAIGGVSEEFPGLSRRAIRAILSDQRQ